MPAISYIHDLNFLFYPEFLTAESRRYYNDQIEWAVQSADHILADSHHTRQDLIDLLSVEPAKVTTVHLAAGSVFAKPHRAETIAGTLTHLGLEPGYILFVGTISPRKNVQVILDAYKLLVRETASRARLVLAGAKGWLADELFDSIAGSDVRGQILHLPGLSDVQMAHLYSAAGLLVMPSFYEGFGLPALEAMHCGCPVVASNRSSLPEVVGDAAIQLDPEDTAGWAGAMKLLLEDTETKDRLVAIGRQQALRFSWSKTAEATLAIYEQFLD